MTLPKRLAGKCTPQVRGDPFCLELRVVQHVVLRQDELQEWVPFLRTPQVLPGLVHPQGSALHGEQLHAEGSLLEEGLKPLFGSEFGLS